MRVDFFDVSAQVQVQELHFDVVTSILISVGALAGQKKIEVKFTPFVNASFSEIDGEMDAKQPKKISSQHILLIFQNLQAASMNV